RAGRHRPRGHPAGIGGALAAGDGRGAAAADATARRAEPQLQLQEGPVVSAAVDGPRGPTAAKLGLLGSRYFSQGLPFGFFTQALPILLRKQGASLGAIGLTTLLALPWALKFLWAPAVDRYALPHVGRRKSWIVPLQIGAVLVLGVLARASASGPLS